jgi:hypothetical protein
MRLLGHTASLSTFRWDLVYLGAQLLSDQRPGVAALAPLVQNTITDIAAERAALEQVEDEAIIANALLQKKDKSRDELLVEVGGVARASDKEVYTILFPKLNPSQTSRLGIAAESAEMKRILGEIVKLPDKHPVRLAYEQELTDAEVAVLGAGQQSDAAVTALALQRSQLDRFKLKIDEMRLTVHGHLLVLLKSKAEADAFFRPTNNAPGEEAKKPDAPAAPTPVAPVAPPAGTP